MLALTEIYGTLSLMLSARPYVTMNFNQRFTSPTANRHRTNKQQAQAL